MESSERSVWISMNIHCARLGIEFRHAPIPVLSMDNQVLKFDGTTLWDE